MSISILASFAISFLSLFTASENIHKDSKIDTEYTRKLVHIGSGILVLFFPFFLNLISVGLLCSSFLVILFISKRKKLLEGINKVERITYGSECFPIAVFLCFLVYKIYDNLLFFYLPISILAFADPAAALLGKNIKSAAITIGDKKKTIAGSIAFFVVALVCSYQSYLFAEYEINFITLLIIGVVTTFIELISKNGFDNLTIPASVITILIIQNSL